jgi:hypothetical protein
MRRAARLRHSDDGAERTAERHVGTTHTLRIANVVAQSGPGIAPDPTTASFTDAPRP